MVTSHNVLDEARQFARSVDFESFAQIGIKLSSQTKVWPGHTVVTYPFYDELRTTSDESGVLCRLALSAEEPVNLYVHIPYCTGICNYCAYSRAVTSSEARQERYIAALEREFGLWCDAAGRTIQSSSLYVGGGTPTALPLHLLKRVALNFQRLQQGGPEFEATCEASPETINDKHGPEKLLCLLDCGFNRLSIGVEAFSDRIATVRGEETFKGWCNRSDSIGNELWLQESEH